jgi:YHS domain-containing protein
MHSNTRVTPRRRWLLATIGAVLSGIALHTLPALAAAPDVNVDAKGLAVHGYDPVAYFTVGKPQPGSANFTATYQGALYRFASQANADAFRAAPAKYAPQYGGYCAMGVALAKKLDGDPTLWRIVDNKLYLNVNADVQKKWSQDIPGNVKKAEETWPRIKDRPAASL